MRLSRVLLLGSALLAAAPAAAQGGVAAPCSRPEVPAPARDLCFTAAQAVESAQPQIGILVAGGNPTLGTASAGGLRLGILPRVTAGVGVNLVLMELPDILAERAGGSATGVGGSVGITAPALSATASIGVFDGIRLTPTVGGFGSIDLLGTATWLPLPDDRFGDGAASVAYGGGVRVGILRESFVTPGVSVSVLHRRLGTVDYGDVCPAGGVATPALATGEGFDLAVGACAQNGDPGEFSADLSGWSGRAVVGKRLLGLGLAAGLGYDRFSSDVAYGFRAPPGTLPGGLDYFARVSAMEVESDRWSAFVDASFTALVATFAAEAGWMQGGGAIDGFPSTSDFDPGDGTFFGSVGVRIAL